MIISHLRGTQHHMDGYSLYVDLDTNEVIVEFANLDAARRLPLTLTLTDASVLRALLNLPDTAAVLLAAEQSRQQTWYEGDADNQRREAQGIAKAYDELRVEHAPPTPPAVSAASALTPEIIAALGPTLAGILAPEIARFYSQPGRTAPPNTEGPQE